MRPKSTQYTVPLRPRRDIWYIALYLESRKKPQAYASILFEAQIRLPLIKISKYVKKRFSEGETEWMMRLDSLACDGA